MKKFTDYQKRKFARDLDIRTAFSGAGYDDSPGTFHCVHCRLYISTHPYVSGVVHRNHCPFCLWSQHVDLYRSGDRLAACRAKMKPVALTIKKVKKKYATGGCGELMIVHLCVDCGALSINRIAADDSPEALIELYHQSKHLPPQISERAQESGIEILDSRFKDLVVSNIFGRETA